jgi:hypothetical protein
MQVFMGLLSVLAARGQAHVRVVVRWLARKPFHNPARPPTASAVSQSINRPVGKIVSRGRDNQGASGQSRSADFQVSRVSKPAATRQSERLANTGAPRRLGSRRHSRFGKLRYVGESTCKNRQLVTARPLVSCLVCFVVSSTAWFRFAPLQPAKTKGARCEAD